MLFFVACNCTECISWRTAYLPYHLTTTTNTIENDTKDEKIQGLMQKIQSKKNWTALRIKMGSGSNNSKKFEESSTNNICLNIRNNYLIICPGTAKTEFFTFHVVTDLSLFFNALSKRNTSYVFSKFCTPVIRHFDKAGTIKFRLV